MTDFSLQADPNCMDDSDPSSLAMDKARSRILDEIRPLDEIDTVSLEEALQRVAAARVVANLDVPPAANSAMDGYAVLSSDIPETATRKLHIIGKSLAGKPFNKAVMPGDCVRITTGGVLPTGTDTVVMQENCLVDGDMITIDTRTGRGDNVRSAGEDFRKGDCIIEQGTLLTPAHIGLVASLGVNSIKVTRKLRVAIFLTGDELRSPGETLEPGQIYDSNRYSLNAMLSHPAIKVIDMGIIPDDEDAIDEAMDTAASRADFVITTGGVSVGDADYVKTALERRGIIHFWKVAMKPGRPLAFGRTGNATFFGLPGNPVSAMVTYYQFVLPAMKRAMGMTVIDLPTFRVICRSNLKKRPGRLEYQRGVLTRTASGEMEVVHTGEQGSGILSSMAMANCFIILPLESDGVVAGETVEVQPFHGIM